MVIDPLQHELEITVLITCYNEAELISNAISNVVLALQGVGAEYEVIVMDDCSTDNSVQVIRQYVADHPDQKIRLHQNLVNRGLANNFIEGAYLGSGKYYRLCCGDDPETLEALTHVFSHIGAADIVIPCMVQKEVQGKSRLRVALSTAFTGIVNVISGYKIGYYNGMPVFRRYHVMRYPPMTCGFGFQADLVTRLLEEGVSYAQILHRGAIDRKGKKATALSMRNLLSVAHTFVEIFFRRLRRMLYGKGQPRAREIRLEQ